MTAVSAWLPADTGVPAALDARLAACVGEWSARWFTAEASTAGSLALRPRPDLHWRALDCGIMLGLAAGGSLALGELIVAVTPGERTAADCTVIEEVAEACLADLRHRIEALVEVPVGAGWSPAFAGPAYTAPIESSARTTLAIGMSTPLFAAMVRDSLDAVEPQALGSAAAALSRISLAVTAKIGRCRLQIADLEDLAVGDVLVLDHAVADAVPLTIDGVQLTRGRCEVAGGDVPTLTIVEPIS